jgi:peptide/nickel transport system permease protein
MRWLPISGRVNPRLDADPSAPFLVINSALHGNWVVFEDSAKHLILPWSVLALLYAATYARMTRNNLLETLGEDYIRTARAKGLGERAVITRHALRSAMTPILTVFGLDIGVLLGGAVLTESTFNLPGLGLAAVQAISSKDLPVILGVTLFAALAIAVANLLVDLLYAVIDPRVRLG